MMKHAKPRKIFLRCNEFGAFWSLMVGLVVGLITFLIGPALVMIVINLLGALAYMAAMFPFAFILLLWVGLVLKSNLGPTHRSGSGLPSAATVT